MRITHSALAQLVEQLTVNQWVAGSSPAGGAKYRKPRIAWFFYFWRSAGREEPSWVRLEFRRAWLDANRTPETYQSRAGRAKYSKPRIAWFFYFWRSAGREEPSWVRLRRRHRSRLGGHHFVVGGAVNSGTIYGDIPDPVYNHPQDSGGGRLIPTISVDQ